MLPEPNYGLIVALLKIKHLNVFKAWKETTIMNGNTEKNDNTAAIERDNMLDVTT